MAAQCLEKRFAAIAEALDFLQFDGRWTGEAQTEYPFRFIPDYRRFHRESWRRTRDFQGIHQKKNHPSQKMASMPLGKATKRAIRSQYNLPFFGMIEWADKPYCQFKKLVSRQFTDPVSAAPKKKLHGSHHLHYPVRHLSEILHILQVAWLISRIRLEESNRIGYGTERVIQTVQKARKQSGDFMLGRSPHLKNLHRPLATFRNYTHS
jgi:hypothetical protein